MKCIKCNQENLESTKYCINCGEKLKSDKKINNLKLFIIVASFLIIGTILLSLFIMFYNTDKELEPYKDNKEEEIKEELEEQNFLSDYYGNYIIKDDNEVLNNYNLDFFSDYVKTRLYDAFSILNNPKFFIKDNETIKEKFNLDDDTIYLYVEDKASKFPFNNKVEFVISNDNIYLYDNDKLLLLEKIEDKYSKNNAFYSINYIEKRYSKEINDELTKLEESIKNSIDYEESLIIKFDYEIIEENNITHISYEYLIGYPYSSGSFDKNTISFITNTLRVINLKEFLEIRNIDFVEFKGDNDISEDSKYYYLDNKIYFVSEIEYESDIVIDLSDFE